LLMDILELSKLVSWKPFSYGHTTGNPYYGSISLTYNPSAVDQGNRSVYHQTLGSDLFGDSSQKYYQSLVGPRRKASLRNTLADSFAINKVVDLNGFSNLKKLIDSVRLTKIRSRISCLFGSRSDAHKFPQKWHNDESVMVNLRINIPVQSSFHYGIEIKTHSDQGQEMHESFFLKVGYAYVYNTNLVHRPFFIGQPDIDRINLIIGVSPWWQFDEGSGYWYSNEFYGEAHPFEIFKMGGISSLF